LAHDTPILRSVVDDDGTSPAALDAAAFIHDPPVSAVGHVVVDDADASTAEPDEDVFLLRDCVRGNVIEAAVCVVVGQKKITRNEI